MLKQRFNSDEPVPTIAKSISYETYEKLIGYKDVDNAAAPSATTDSYNAAAAAATHDDDEDDEDEDEVDDYDEDDDSQEEVKKFSLGGFLYLLLDNIGAFFRHQPNVTEGLNHHNCVHLEMFGLNFNMNSNLDKFE